MGVFGAPVTHEDDPERAVRAALELTEAVKALGEEVGIPTLRARAGVLTGEAAVALNATNQGMVAGDLVNTAARLQGVAEAGTVLVGEATRRAAEGAIVFDPLGDHSLKGKTAPAGPAGSRQGLNDFTGWFAGNPDMAGDYLGYDGPYPPFNDERVHRYFFRVFALDVATLSLPERFTAADAYRAMHGHVLAEAALHGTYTLNPALA